MYWLLLQLAFAEPAQICTLKSQFFEPYAEELKPWTTVTRIEKPQEQLRAGDVLVYLIPPRGERPFEPSDAWLKMLRDKPHVTTVIRKDGVLKLISSAFLGDNFMEDFESDRPYLALRPKVEESKRKAFEDSFSHYMSRLGEIGMEYDPWAVIDVLDPNYVNFLRDKLDSKCSKSDVRPVYCSEVPLTGYALANFPLPKGTPLYEMLDGAVEVVQKLDPKKSLETRISETADDIVLGFLEPLEGKLEELQNDLLAIEREKKSLQDLATKFKGSFIPKSAIEQYRHVRHKDTRRIGPLLKDKREEITGASIQKELVRLNALYFTGQAQNVKLSAEINGYKLVGETLKKVLIKRIRKEPLTPEERQMLSKEIVRPHDIVRAAQEGSFTLVGFYPGQLPEGCLKDPSGKTLHLPYKVHRP